MKRKILLVFIIFSLLGCNEDETIQEILPIITTFEISEITGNNATSGGNITNDGGNNIIARGVCWSTSFTPTIDDDFTTDGLGFGSFTSSLTELKGNTTYYLRPYATTSAGTAYGEELSFSTLESIYEGDLELLTQEDIDLIGEKGYSRINGSVVIGALAKVSPSLIVNLEGLRQVTTIEGELILANLDNLIHLDDLSNLTFVGGHLRIHNNDKLTNIDGLVQITSCNNLIIAYNGTLINLDGLSNITSVGGLLLIEHNNSLDNIDGLSNLTSINGGSLVIWGNSSLVNINGLEKLTSIEGGLVIRNNSGLADINGLSNLISIDKEVDITNNVALVHIDGLSNLTSIGGDLEITSNIILASLEGLSNLNHLTGPKLVIENNDALTHLDGFLSSVTSSNVRFLFIIENDKLNDFCGFKQFLQNSQLITFEEIIDNAFNPSIENIISGNCSQ